MSESKHSGASRRQFLAASATAAALPWIGRAQQAKGAVEAPRSLLVLELSGGNDGLNTVVPVRHDRYRRSRPTLRVSADAAHALDDEFSLHPSLSGLARVHEQGELAVVQAVGYERPNRSHFESRDIWHRASRVSEEGRRTGWLGRVADWMRQRDPASTPALVIGEREVPLALTGARASTPVLRDLQDLSAPEDPGRVDVQRRLARELEADAADSLQFLRRTTRQTLEQRERLRAAIAASPSRVEYPDTDLGRRLKIAAQLLIGGFPCPVMYVSHGGYDTHAFQAEVHALLLRELDEALAAFHQDLREHELGDRVLSFVHSEFGRRVKENGSRGTDHGAGGPCLLLSGAVKPGLHGTRRLLDDLEEGDVRARLDFRQLYATLLEDWLGVPAKVALEGDWEKLALLG